MKIFHGATLVATHGEEFRASRMVRDDAHFVGLWRAVDVPPIEALSGPVSLRSAESLDDYARVIGGAA